MAFFDHVYAVLDPVTADEVAHCDYLRSFGRFDVHTTVADDETWTGRYLFGKTKYLELFGPTDFGGPEEAVGSTGLALSTRARGGLATLSDRLKAGGPRTEVKRRTRHEDEEEVPWFDYLSPTDATHTFSVWVMEFLGDPTDLHVRESAFSEWIEQTEGARRRPLLQDISAVELAATAEDIAIAWPLLETAGYAMSDDGGVVTARDGETTIVMRRKPTEAVGLTRIEFRLAAPAEAPHIETIGGSTLTVGPGSHAAWDFMHA